jgi:uncharacterized protein YrrD
MHVRALHIRGMHVVDDSTQFVVALLDSPLIHPDTGEIVGFFVLPVHGFVTGPLFLSTLDIIQWGTVIHIRSEDVLAPPSELVRLQEHLLDRRTFLGQLIRVRPGGRTLGRCSDVQFDTDSYKVEWLFPRRWLLRIDPIPSSEVIEVTSKAIWIRPPIRTVADRTSVTDEQVKHAVHIDPAPAVTMRKD